jgi:ribonuclease BN (tRNA processing enzyme)
MNRGTDRRASLLLLAVIVAAGPIVGLSSADNDGAPSARSTQLLFLGTGGGPPLRVDRSEPSTLLIVDDRPYLIDCGIGTMRRMLEAGVASETIRTIFFTHLHADHDLGLADVMANDFFSLNQAGSSPRIDIYGPPQTTQLVDAAFHYIAYGFTAFAAEPGAIREGLVNGALKSPFEGHEIQRDGVIFQDDKIRVTAAENSHYSLMPPPSNQEMKSYSYRFETPHGVVVFTGDTGPNEAVIRLAARADVLVSEIQSENNVGQFVKQMGEQNHWTPERTAALMDHMLREHLTEKDAGAIATRAHVKSLVLYHYNAANSAGYIAAVKPYFDGPVLGSADLARFCLDASKTPAVEKCN